MDLHWHSCSSPLWLSCCFWACTVCIPYSFKCEINLLLHPHSANIRFTRTLPPGSVLVNQILHSQGCNNIILTCSMICPIRWISVTYVKNYNTCHTSVSLQMNIINVIITYWCLLCMVVFCCAPAKMATSIQHFSNFMKLLHCFYVSNFMLWSIFFNHF